MIKYKYSDKANDRDDAADTAIEEINLRSDTPESCLLSNQILNQPASGYKIECVADYNPYFYKLCPNGMRDLDISYDQRPSCCNSVSSVCNNRGGEPSKCIRGSIYSCYNEMKLMDMKM